MSQRDSGYARKERDCYETPEWVTYALLPHLRPLAAIWEPACGGGQMVRVLEKSGAYVLGSDIDQGDDFLQLSLPPGSQWDAIITNPPYELAARFCEHALRLMANTRGAVAMLLRTDFDHAKSRTHLFGDCQAFARKIVLRRRICWFVEANGKPKASPSYNHAWYLWDWTHDGPPIIRYAA